MPIHRVRLLLLFSLCILFLLPVASPRQAAALSSPITITSQTYAISFPDSIKFNLNADDANSTIARASIFITFGPDGDQQQDTGTLTVNPPAHAVSLHFNENTSSSHFHPPGTPVSYYWQIWDSAGYSDVGTIAQFSTIDTRFTWQHLSQGLLQVNWYNRPQGFGQIMLNQAADNINRISGVLGGGLIYPINLWIYQSDADFHGSLSPGSYEWVGGEALPTLQEASIVVVNPSDTTLVRDMPHELTHLIFHQLTGQGIYAPTWFDEGLAVYNQIFHEQEMMQRFIQARDTHTLIRLSTLAFGFPADADQAYLAYAQSWQLLDYMYNTFRQPKMAQLIRQMNNPQTSFDEDLQKVLGEDQLHLENQWYLYLHQPPLLAPDQLTPTAQATSQAKQPQPTAANGHSGNFWLPVGIGLGALLILGALSGLTLSFINTRRRREREMAVQAASHLIVGNRTDPRQNHAAPPYGYEYPDPSTYMRGSMYAPPDRQPEPPASQQSQSPPFFQNQEFSSQPQGKQAPQE